MFRLCCGSAVGYGELCIGGSFVDVLVGRVDVVWCGIGRGCCGNVPADDIVEHVLFILLNRAHVVDLSFFKQETW